LSCITFALYFNFFIQVIENFEKSKKSNKKLKFVLDTSSLNEPSTPSKAVSLNKNVKSQVLSASLIPNTPITDPSRSLLADITPDISNTDTFLPLTNITMSYMSSSEDSQLANITKPYSNPSIDPLSNAERSILSATSGMFLGNIITSKKIENNKNT